MTHPASSTPHAFDPVLRLLHWAIALSVVALITTSQLADVLEHGPYENTVWNLHILAGYAFTASLVTRLLWGLVGPASARWRDLWHPAVWMGTLRTFRLPGVHRVGHDPLASLAYLLAYGVMAFMVITGLGLAASEFQAGPLAAWLGQASWLEDVLEDPHEAGFVLMLGFIGLHMAALIFHQWRGEHVARRMLIGKRNPPTSSEVQHD